MKTEQQQTLLFHGISDDFFPTYHKENPQIYEAFEKFTLEAIKKGHKKFSAEFIFNIIRWKTGVSAEADKFKVNNNYKAFYSRLFMNNNEEYKDFFRTRKSKYD